MEKNYDDTFLARWIAGELTPEALSEFESSTEYSEYKKIIEGVSRLEAPSFDRQATLDAIKAKTHQKPPVKTRRLLPRALMAAAAAVLVLIGYFTFFSSTSYDTGIGERIALTLPSGSEITLDPASKVTFNTRSWKNQRTISLEGAALFDVTKGSPFLVETPRGVIEVLGTSFKVTSRDNFFDVSCFQGRVSVNVDGQEFILTKGKAVRMNNDIPFPYEMATTTQGATENQIAFYNAPIIFVIEELERQYGIRVTNKEASGKQHFTGTIPTNNVEAAVQTIFEAMEIRYTFDSNGNVVIQK